MKITLCISTIFIIISSWSLAKFVTTVFAVDSINNNNNNNAIADSDNDVDMNHEHYCNKNNVVMDTIDKRPETETNTNKATDITPSPYIFLKDDNRYRTIPKSSLNLYETLPLGTYSVGIDTRSNEYYLKVIDDFVIDGKLYGDPHRNADRILQTFQDRKSCTGVLLAGEKGSGKTLLAKLISIKASKNFDIPTLVVNSNFSGESFNLFLSSIQQPVVIIFDEFEKVYGHSKQERMLTLLDGVYPSKKLFILTCNDVHHINDNMLNRPGRLYYMLEFHGVDESFIREYCKDKLKKENQQYISNIAAISTFFSPLNFDLLKAMVEEINRYDESPAQVLKFLNAHPQEAYGIYTFELFSENNGKPLDLCSTSSKGINDCNEWTGNPIYDSIFISHRHKNEPLSMNNNNEKLKVEEDEAKENVENHHQGEQSNDDTSASPSNYYIEFKPKDMERSLDAKSLVYVNSKGFKLVLNNKKLHPSREKPSTSIFARRFLFDDDDDDDDDDYVFRFQ